MLVLVGLTEARLRDVIPLHGHDVLPGGGGRGRSGGRRSVAADGRGELAHGPVHHPSECLHRHGFFVCFFSPPAAGSCCSVQVVTALRACAVDAAAAWAGRRRLETRRFTSPLAFGE